MLSAPRYGLCMPRGRSAVVTGKLPAFAVDPRSDLPLHAQVADHLVKIVDDGVLLGGDRLDGEVGLASRWGISRATLRRAINDLVGQGVLLRRHGVGTQVAPRPGWRSTGVRSLYDEMVEADRRPATTVRALTVGRATPDVAETLELSADAEIYAIERLRLVEEEPLALMRNWLAVSLVELDADLLSRSGLYEILRAHGIEMAIARQSVGAQKAGADEARLLQVEEGDALLSVYTVSYAAMGEPIELGRHLYRADGFRLQVTNVER